MLIDERQEIKANCKQIQGELMTTAIGWFHITSLTFSCTQSETLWIYAWSRMKESHIIVMCDNADPSEANLIAFSSSWIPFRAQIKSIIEKSRQLYANMSSFTNKENRKSATTGSFLKQFAAQLLSQIIAFSTIEESSSLFSFFYNQNYFDLDDFVNEGKFGIFKGFLCVCNNFNDAFFSESFQIKLLAKWNLGWSFHNKTLTNFI